MIAQLRFDDPPAQKTPTSLNAAESIKPSRETLRERVFAFICENGPVCDEEIADGLSMNPSTQRPRRIELWGQNRIHQQGYSTTRAGRRAQAWMAN